MSGAVAVGDALSLMLWEVRHALRQLIPWRVVRRGGVGLLAVLELAFVCALLFLPRHSTRQLSLGTFVGFVGLNLGLAAACAGLAVAQLLTHPRRLGLSWLAPLSPQLALAVALAPAVVAALCPLTLVGLPFALAAARIAPGVAVGLLIAGGCALGWAVVVAVGLGAGLGRWLGPLHGARALQLVSGALGLGAIVSFRVLVRLELGASALIAFLVATPILLPVVGARAAAALRAVVRGTASARRSPAPVWGRPGWLRQLGRAVSAVGLLGLIPVVAVAVAFPALRLSVAGILLLQLAALPLERLLAPEFATPDRLRLAPEGNRYRWSLLGLWGGGAVGVIAGAAAALAWPNLRWAGALALLGALVPFTYLFRQRVLRVLGQLALLAGSLGATAAWGHAPWRPL